MGKRASWVQTLLFLAFIGAFFVLNLVLPKREFSEQENRMLQTAPKFTLASLFSGNFTSSFETYLTDQFAFRDAWTTLKARAELMSGKAENRRQEVMFPVPAGHSLVMSLPQCPQKKEIAAPSTSLS